MKLTCLVDVDDLLSEYGQEVIRFANRYGRTADQREYALEDLTDFDSWKALNLESLKDRFHQHLVDTNYCRHAPLLPGAQDFVGALRETAHVVFVTSPHSFVENWTHARTAWLREHFNAYKDDIIHTSGKRHVRGDFLIDDKYENCESFPGYAICFDKPWNRRPGMKLRAYDYGDVIELIEAHT